MSHSSSQDIKDTEQFDQLGDQWWALDGPMKPLHDFTPVRVDYIVNMIKRAGLASADDSKPLSSLRILDVGCGGGLLAEPLARLGAEMTAIDASAAAIKAAQDHAQSQSLTIDYRSVLAETLAEEGACFDVIYSSEVIEHVADRHVFIKAISDMLRQDGLVLFTTINRTLAAFATIKIGAEYIVKLIPKGTHDFHKFVKPDELAEECQAHGLMLDHFTGFVPRPSGGFMTSSFMGINYAASGRHI